MYMNGIIIINKPSGYTSQDVISKVKKIMNVKKVGHTGTLDPMATGVLPVLLGNATKLSKYLIEHDKTYVSTIKLGEKRDTGDSEGSIIEKKDADIDFNSVESVLNTFLGVQKQTPPIYSAIKVKGKKLYEYARANEQVVIPEREIEIYDIKLKSIDNKNHEIIFEVNCSKGTYIRVLSENISEKLGTVGYMKELRRTKVNKFDIENSITLEELEQNINNELFIKNNIITMEKVFENYDKIIIGDKKKELFLNGVMLTFDKKDGIYNIYSEKKGYIGTGIVKNKLLKRDVII